MRPYLEALVRRAADPVQARNLVREYLQARILAALQRAGAMVPLAFQGGTALRFLFDLPRHSEDLDFALERERGRFAAAELAEAARAELAAEGYAVQQRPGRGKVVESASLSFPGLLFDLGLSAHRDQALSVKIEVDTRPPAGARLAVTLVRRHVVLRLQHHDRASLLAGKIHALLTRPYTKGRDLFDLLWYLSDRRWPAPNLVLLNNALRETGWTGRPLTARNWKAALAARVERLDFDGAVRDVRPFLEPGAGVELLTRENLRRLLR